MIHNVYNTKFILKKLEETQIQKSLKLHPLLAKLDGRSPRFLLGRCVKVECRPLVALPYHLVQLGGAGLSQTVEQFTSTGRTLATGFATIAEPGSRVVTADFVDLREAMEMGSRVRSWCNRNCTRDQISHRQSWCNAINAICYLYLALNDSIMMTF